MLADAAYTLKYVIVIAVGLLFYGLLGFLILRGYRRLVAASTRAQARAYEGVWVSQEPKAGLVRVTFHAYSGFLIFVRQVEHRFWATPDDARLILARLHRFNLTWGFFAYGALLIPLLSLVNYRAQRNRIARQASRLAELPSAARRDPSL